MASTFLKIIQEAREDLKTSLEDLHSLDSRIIQDCGRRLFYDAYRSNSEFTQINRVIWTRSETKMHSFIVAFHAKLAILFNVHCWQWMSLWILVFKKQIVFALPCICHSLLASEKKKKALVSGEWWRGGHRSGSAGHRNLFLQAMPVRELDGCYLISVWTL